MHLVFEACPDFDQALAVPDNLPQFPYLFVSRYAISKTQLLLAFFSKFRSGGTL